MASLRLSISLDSNSGKNYLNSKKLHNNKPTTEFKPDFKTEHFNNNNTILKQLQNAAKTPSFKPKRNAVIDTYNDKIRTLTVTQDWESAENLIHEIKSSSPENLTFRVFNTVIYASSKRGLVEIASKWFRLMLDFNVTPNVATFGMLMSLYKKKGSNVEEAEFTMSQMNRFGIVCESAYSCMITIYTRLGLYEKAEAVIIELMSKEELNLENWLVIMNTYCQQGKMVDAEKVFVKMQELGFCLNVVAYNTMITGYGKASDMVSAEKVFRSIDVPDETSYRSMIEGWGRIDDYEKANWYYKELKELGYSPSSSNLYTMLKLRARFGDGEECVVGILDDMVRCGCGYSSMIATLMSVYEGAGKVCEVPGLLKGSLYQHVLVNQSSCSTVVMAYVKHQLVDDAVKVLREKKWRDLRYEESLYHLLICSCKDAGLLEVAVGIYKRMPKGDDDGDKKKKPNKHILCTMIDIYGHMGLYKDAEMMYAKLKACPPDSSLDMIALSIIVRMYIRAGSLKDACSVLDEVDKQPHIIPDVFLLRDMLRVYQRCNMVDKLAQLYYKISKDRANWDQELYNCVLNCCAHAISVDELSRLFDEMLQRGFVPNTITYNVMLHVFGKAKLFKKVRKLYYMAKKQDLVDPITYNTIIAAYGKNKDFKNMSSTVQKMQLDGFSVSLEAYNSMLDAYGKGGQMETFRSVLQRMKESKCVSDHYTYNTVINIYGKQGWLEEVADVLAELKECGLGPDLCSYNTLIKAYGIGGMVEEAVGLMKEMRENGIEPDQGTYTNLITALKRNDKYLEAVKWSLWMKLGVAKWTDGSIHVHILMDWMISIHLSI